MSGVPEATFETKPPWETSLGPGCEARDCDYAANVKYRSGAPWLCDDHKADWLEQEVDRMREALEEIANNKHVIGWLYAGQIAEEALR